MWINGSIAAQCPLASAADSFKTSALSIPFAGLDAAVKPDCRRSEALLQTLIINALYSNAEAVEGVSYQIK